MITIETYRITGISSLLMHNPDAMSGGSGETLTTASKNVPPALVEAEASAYRAGNGVLYVPTRCLRGSLLKGCTNRKVGKVAASGRVAAGVFTLDDEQEAPLFHPASGDPIETYLAKGMRCVIKQGTKKNGIIRYRAEVFPWACNARFLVDDDFVNARQVLDIFNYAGRIAGILDYRPETKGPHGRYWVQHVRTEPSKAVDYAAAAE